MYFVIGDFLSFLFAPVISRAWQTRSARRIYFRKTSRWIRAPSIESAPTETTRTHEKARRRRHRLRIIALLYLRSRSYRRTRTRSVGRKCGDRHDTRRERESFEGPIAWSTLRGQRLCSRTFITRACDKHTVAAVHDGIEFMLRKKRIIVLAEGLGHSIPRGHLSSKILPFRRPASLRRADAAGQSSPKGWIPAMNYCFRALYVRARRRLVCDDSS